MDRVLEFFSSETKIGILFAVVSIAIVGKYILGSKKTKTIRMVLDPEEYKPFKLKEKKIINHNTRLFRFALPREDDVLGLPIGQHLSFRAIIDSQEVLRSYTPVSSDDDLGHFDLVVKVYEKGLMSKYFDNMNIGQTIDVKGPKGKFVYEPNMRKTLGMLAGGTGITPMLQVVSAILKNPADKTQISLIFANVNDNDILLQQELEELVKKYPQFKIYYVLNNSPANWKGGVGFVSREMIEANLPKPSGDTMILMCGPPMMNKAMVGHLEAIGYLENQYFRF